MQNDRIDAPAAVEWWPLEKIIPYARNAKIHSDADVAQLASMIKEYGWTYPILVDEEGIILAGHGRRAAALLLDLKRAPVMVKTGLSKAQKQAYRIADNKRPELAPWDNELLKIELAELSELGFDLALTAFADDEIQEFFQSETSETEPGDAEPQSDRAEELLERWQVQPGDLWQLGDHRLICGDCTDAAIVDQLLAGEAIDLAFTSPPYADRRKYDEKSDFRPIDPDHYVAWFHGVAQNVSRHLADGGSWFINICPGAENRQRRRYVLDLLVDHLAMGWLFLDEYAWPAGQMPLDPKQIGRFKQGFEMIYGFCKTTDYKFRPDNVRHESDAAFTYGGVDARISHDYQGTKELTKRTKMQKTGHGLAYPSTLLSKIGKDKVLGHAAAFPVGLPQFFINAYTDPGDLVYEPFAGSGTTLVACQNSGRKGRGVEISPAYCSVILQRMREAFPDLPIERVTSD